MATNFFLSTRYISLFYTHPHTNTLTHTHTHTLISLSLLNTHTHHFTLSKQSNFVFAHLAFLFQLLFCNNLTQKSTETGERKLVYNVMLAEGTFKHLKGGVWCCSRIAFEFLLNRSILWSWNKLFVLLDDNKLQLLFYFFILQSTHEVIYSISSKRNWILYFLLLNIRSLLNDTHGKIISLFKTSLVKSFFSYQESW
jgi:hypothetical protein